MITWVLEGLKDAFYWFLDLVFSVFGALVGVLFDLLPTAWKASIEAGVAQVQPVFEAINRWVPIQEAIGMYLAYLLILVLFSVVKIVIKMIPGIG